MKQPANEVPSEVLVEVMVVVELMASLEKLMVCKWHEQEISLPGPHSRST